MTDDGSILAIGETGVGMNESGLVRAFVFNGSVWTAYGQPIEGEAVNDLSGRSVALSSTGLFLAVGAQYNDAQDQSDSKRGHVRVFLFDGSRWIQDGSDIDGADFEDTMGGSVAISALGDTVAAGAPLAYGQGVEVSGAARVFHKASVQEGDWTQVGVDLPGEAEGDNFGWTVSISEDANIVAAGAPGNSRNGPRSGHVRIHRFVGNDWIQMGQDIYGEQGELAGSCVSLNGNGTILAVGSAEYSDESVNEGGRLRIFSFDGESWNETANIVGTSGTSAGFGWSCSISRDGTRVSGGAYGATVDGIARTGVVQSFGLFGSTWKQIGQDLVGDATVNQFGYSVALSKDGTTVAVGANLHDINGDLSGQVSVYRLEAMNDP